MFMQFKLGPDMAVCLVKAVFFSLLSVFTVMPGLLMLMGELMAKTRHKNFVPKVPFVGRFAYATRSIIPPIFSPIFFIFFARYSVMLLLPSPCTVAPRSPSRT